MPLKNWVLGALAVTLVSCGGAPQPDTDSEASAPGTNAQSEAAAIEAAQAEWKARQQEINQVLSSVDRAGFIGDSPTQGSANAEVVVVKFSDFECPFCAVAAGQMKDFLDERGDEVLYVYKHFPLTSIHDEAVPAAKAAWAAGQQGQFWLYHDGLFANQDRLGEPLYEELAQAIQLDVEQFNRDRNSDAAQTAVDADMQLAQQLKLRGTPSFLMGGLLIPSGIAPQDFGQLLDNLKAQLPDDQ